MCAYKEPGKKGRSRDDALARNPAVKQLRGNHFDLIGSPPTSRPSSSHSAVRDSSPLRSDVPATPELRGARKHGKRGGHHRRTRFVGSSSLDSPSLYRIDSGTSPTATGAGRHILSRDNKSLQNLSVLGRLVDDRTGFHEEKRVSDEQLAEIGKRKNGSALRAYYEKLNETLDGWREVDEILDSRFPEEVMLRFGSMEEVERFNGMRKRLPWIEGGGGADSDTTESGYQEESEDSDGDVSRQRRGSLARAASALSGLWFGSGSTPRQRSRLGQAGGDEEAALLSSSASGTPVRGRGAPALRYGSTAFTTSGTGLSTIDDDNAGESDATRRVGPANISEVTPPSVSGLEHASRGMSPPKAGTVRSTTPSGQNVRAIENGVMADKVNGKQAKARPRMYRRRSQEDESDTDSDDEYDENDEVQSDEVQPGKLDVQLAAERNERKARTRERQAALTGVAPSERASSNSASRERKKTQPGGTSERDRMKLLQHLPGRQEREGEREKGAQFAININMAVNVLLLAGKVFAVFSSNSVSLIASLVDSALDLLSTMIIFGTSKAISYRSFHTYFKYPVGKKRFEPLGVVIFAVLMIASFCQVLVESIERLYKVVRTGSENPGESANLPWVGVAFMLLTILIKAFMWLIYRKSHSSGVRAVAQDAENDVVFNIASLIFPVVGSKLGWPALDPIGGVCLSIYIITEWLETLMETMTKLTGSVGSPQDVSRALYLTLRFRSVNSVGALEVYHAGDDVIIEADIVFPYGFALKEAHDAGEIVCYSMEMLSGVERAFVHADYNPLGQAGHVTQRG